jgi:hypothetical protein
VNGDRHQARPGTPVALGTGHPAYRLPTPESDISGKEMIVLQTSGKSSLLQSFTEAIDELKYKSQRDHRLLVLSCYIDFKAIKKLIDRTSKIVRLTKVRLAFELLEAFRSRLPNDTLFELKELKVWCTKRGVEFLWYPLRAGTLMHAKGYALVQQQGQKNRSGVVSIGSGNATLRGLGLSMGTNVNIEMAIVSNSNDDLNEFIRCWRLLMKNKRTLENAALCEDEYEFSFKLLASGVFLHDWRVSLTSQIGIKYALTEEGKEQLALKDPELERLGFTADRATISRNPFRSVMLPNDRALPHEFSKNYTVDTFLGRWCPKSVWDVVEQTIRRDDEFRRFFRGFQAATTSSNLVRITEAEKEISTGLTNRGIISADPERIARWQSKMEMLRENKNMLARIFMKYSAVELPYDYSARRDIQDLKDSMFESMAVRSRQFLAARKVAEAQQQRNTRALELTVDELSTLKKELRKS